MSDISGVTADSAPAPELPIDTPNPVNTEDQGHPKEPEAKPEAKPEKAAKPEDKPLTTREALQKAAAKVEKDSKAAEKADTKEVKTEAKPADKASDKPGEVKTEKPRADNGQFASKEAKTEAKPSYTAGEPPARFTADVKASWATLPENVRGEVSRMERELTQGYEKHKAGAERDATLNEFHDMAKQSGKQLSDVVRAYVGMENLLRTDPNKAFEQLLQRVGSSPRQYAEHILGQTPDQNANQQDATIRELKQTIGQLQQQVGQVSQTFHQQRESAVLQDVTKFAQDNPRFEELSGDIAFFMKSGRAKDLSEAYTLAERLNPAAPAASDVKPAASSAAQDLSIQTEKGQKSIKGAPDAGSDPVSRKPSTSIKESIRRAMAQSG